MSGEDEIRRWMAAKLDRDLEAAFGVSNTTATEPSPLTAADIDQMARKWERMAVAMRRTAVWFVIDPMLAVGSPITKHQSAVEGTIFTMDHRTANEINQHWPITLDHADEQGCGWFRPAHQGEFVSRIVPPPPYDMPDECAPDVHTDSNKP